MCGVQAQPSMLFWLSQKVSGDSGFQCDANVYLLDESHVFLCVSVCVFVFEVTGDYSFFQRAPEIV